MLWQICFILVLVRQLLIIQDYLLKIFICVIIIISFVPNKLSGMTNQLLILFSKYGCFRFVLFFYSPFVVFREPLNGWQSHGCYAETSG